MTFKKAMLSAFITVTLTIVIRSILRANGIHNFLSENVAGEFLLYGAIYSLFFLVFKRQSEK